MIPDCIPRADGPCLVPCLPDDYMRTGFHVARRHDWPDARRLEIVFLDVWSDDRGHLVALHRCGTGTVEDPQEWEFRHRVVGLHSPSEETLELDAVEAAPALH